MRRWSRRAAAIFGAVLALVLLTPLGPAGLALLIERGSGDWQVAVGDQGGVLLFGFSLSEIHCENQALGLDVEIESLAVAPWSWSVAVQAPVVQMAVVADETDEPPADIELPIALLPDLAVTAGRLDVQVGESALSVREWQAGYRATADTVGQFELESADVRVTGLDNAVGMRLLVDLSPHRIERGMLDVEYYSGDSLNVSWQTTAVMGLELPRLLRVSSLAKVRGDSLEGDLRVELDGALAPLRLDGPLTGAGHMPGLPAVDGRGFLRVEGDAPRLALDSLVVSLLGGTLAGSAEYAADSLTVELAGEEMDLAPLVEVGGRLGFGLTAAVDLASMRYAADGAARVRGVELAVGDEVRRIDADVRLAHRPEGHTRLEWSSQPLDVHAVGVSDLEGAYDLELTGVVRPGIFFAEAADASIAGRATPDSLGLSLRSVPLPGALGSALGAVAADLRLRALRHLTADLRLGGDALVARAEFDVAQGRIDTLEATLSKLPLGELVPALDGALDAHVAGAGGLALADWRLQGRASTPGLAYAGWRSGALRVDLALAGGAVQALIGGPGVRGAVQLDSVGRLTADAEFAGRLLAGAGDDALDLQGRLRWQGPLTDPGMANGRLSLDSLSLRQGPWVLRNASALAADYRAGALSLAPARLSTSVGPLELAGRASADSLALSLSLPELQLDGLVPDFDGRGSGQLQVGGTLERPTARGSVHLAAMRLDTFALGAARAEWTLSDSLALGVEALAGARLDLTVPAAPLLGRGSGRAEVTLTTAGADFGPVLGYVVGHPLDARLDLAGTVQVPLGDSALAWDAVSGRLDVRNFRVETLVEGDSLQLDLLSQGSLALARGRVGLGGLALELRRYDRNEGRLRPAGAMRLEGEADPSASSRLGLDLTQVDLALLGGPEGKADLRADFSGTTAAPTLDAELTVETEDFGEVFGRFAGDGRGVDGRLSWVTLIEDSLVVTGHVPWDLAAGTAALDRGWLAARSAGIGLFVFADLIADLDHLDGRIGADLRVDGLDSTLALSGEIGVEGLELALLDLEPVYALPDGRLRLDGRRVELEGFAAAGEPQRGFRRLALSGHLDLGRLDDPGFDLRLEAERLASRYQDIFKADDIFLDLAFAGAASGSRLAGKIRLNQPRSEPTLVVFNAPPVPPPPPALRDEFLENMALDVELDLRGLALDSELAEVGASGALEIGGTFYKPLFQGQMEIDEGGRIRLLNQDFAFESGRVAFNSLEPTGSILDVAYDPLELNPELDLRASTVVEDIQDEEEYAVTLLLQGRAQEVVPQFSSAPVQDFAHIVNLLAFNTTSLANADYAAALGTVAGQLLSSRVEKVGLDDFAVLPSSTVVGANPGAAIRVGKYFGGMPLPVWVRYEALLEEMSSGEVRIEHKLKSFLTVTGSAQSEYDRYGLGIGLKKKF